MYNPRRYEVKWLGCDTAGRAWPNTLEPRANVQDTRAFKLFMRAQVATRGQQNEAKQIKNIYELVLHALQL